VNLNEECEKFSQGKRLQYNRKGGLRLEGSVAVEMAFNWRAHIG